MGTGASKSIDMVEIDDQQNNLGKDWNLEKIDL
jgi:hypothetical protein